LYLVLPAFVFKAAGFVEVVSTGVRKIAKKRIVILSFKISRKIEGGMILSRLVILNAVKDLPRYKSLQ
jgi:hypothetical protein